MVCRLGASEVLPTLEQTPVLEATLEGKALFCSVNMLISIFLSFDQFNVFLTDHLFLLWPRQDLTRLTVLWVETICKVTTRLIW